MQAFPVALGPVPDFFVDVFSRSSRDAVFGRPTDRVADEVSTFGSVRFRLPFGFMLFGLFSFFFVDQCPIAGDRQENQGFLEAKQEVSKSRERQKSERTFRSKERNRSAIKSTPGKESREE